MDINYEIDLKDEESNYQYGNHEIETVFIYEEHDGLGYEDDSDTISNCESIIENDHDDDVKTELTNITNSEYEEINDNKNEFISLEEPKVTYAVTEDIDDKSNDDNNRNIQHINRFNALNTYINGVQLFFKEYVTSYTDFIHITSNYNTRSGSLCRVWKTLPRSVLDIRVPKGHKGGVFAVRYIPKGIRLGPIEGIMNTKRDVCYAWRFENGRLHYTSKLNFSNWPRFVNYASTKAEQNLTIFQHDRYLYFRTVKDISVDEELLVRYENILTENLYGQEYCVPYIERKFIKAQFCFHCNLGFKDEFSLKSHNCIAPNEISEFEITTCHSCNLFTCERKYIESHLENCEGTNDEHVAGESQEQKYDCSDNSEENTLIHISSHYYLNVAPSKRSWKSLPRAALTIKTWKQHAGGVFAVIKIPKDVIFGPYEGLTWEKIGNRFGYLIENGKLVHNTRSNCESWMRYVNAAQGANEENLTVFQNRGCLYFQAVRDIKVDEELLVYLWYLQVVELYGQSFCVPPVAVGIPKAFFCSKCCLGFGSPKFIPMHERTCNIPKISDKEISTCPFCKVFACEGKYIANHIALCSENPDSKEFHKDNTKPKRKNRYITPKNINDNVIRIASYYSVRFGMNMRPWKTLPRSVLTIKAGEEHAGGVFAVIRIPNDVVLGPYDGLISEKVGVKSAYLFENGKLAHNTNPNYTNWMRFVNRAPSSNERNLTVFQYCDNLYFQTTRAVQADEELLVFFDGIETMEVRGSTFLVPRILTNVPTAYFCETCRLGFGNLALLDVHHGVCEVVSVGEEDVATCPFCKLFTCERKYLENHKALCPDGSVDWPVLTKEGKCRFCNMPVDDLQTHLRKHNIKRKTLRYDEGNFTCSKPDDLAVHKKDKCVVKDLAFDRNHAEDIEFCDPGKDNGDRVREEEDDDGEMACEETPRKRWRRCSCGENSDHTYAEDESMNMSEEVRSFFKGFELLKEGKCRFCSTPHDDLRWHMIVKHSIKRKVLQCNMCNFLCSKMDDLLAHKNDYCIKKDPSFDKNYTKDIELCDPRRDLMKYTKGGNKRDLDEGERINDSAEDNVRKDLDVSALFAELAETATTTRKPYRCPFCDFNTIRRYALQRHLKSRHRIIVYKDQIHTGGMMYISGLSRELMQGPERVKCPVCGVYRHYLRLHLKKRHRQGNRYKCDDCDFTCETANNLLSHARTHEKDSSSESEGSSNTTDDDNTDEVDPLKEELEKVELNMYGFIHF